MNHVKATQELTAELYKQKGQIDLLKELLAGKNEPRSSGQVS